MSAKQQAVACALALCRGQPCLMFFQNCEFESKAEQRARKAG
ncbi:hypothetical protein [Propionispora vibrioides]|uniref:Uncharacterized protein n=1 Tax=Propionispora vibrioides TaxID=112903 RepID=A0A1H8Y3Q2_9FIRM|nr:hypothetical protein [Propionispora vibrioides]SEP46719.1 hypothetical protein SAMN04490178_14025 [Propionispora vibrioides]